ncbi:MAG: hypothetical protein WBG98_03210, partial [Brucella anthropi]
MQAARTLVSTPASNNIVERRALFMFGFMLLKAQVLCGRAFSVQNNLSILSTCILPESRFAVSGLRLWQFYRRLRLILQSY